MYYEVNALNSNRIKCLFNNASTYRAVNTPHLRCKHHSVHVVVWNKSFFCSWIHINRINALSVQNVEFLDVKPGGAKSNR